MRDHEILRKQQARWQQQWRLGRTRDPSESAMVRRPELPGRSVFANGVHPTPLTYT